MSYKEVNVRCPFFQKENGKTEIRCEGLVRDSYIVLRHLKKADWAAQMKGFCQGRYTNCEIYRILIEKEEYE